MKIPLYSGLLLCVCTSLVAQTLQSFRIPWNDASSGPTNLRSWQPTEAGASGWVTVDSTGRYQAGGERIRFLGVNVTADGCFPAAAQATGHAARLARFGFNAVRFHHMEAPWAKSSVLVDYNAGNSRSLSAQRLDRLHYFVAELAKQGIYSNINLLVSREFQPTDGLGAEISQLGWKDQHILGFFMPAAVALHKEYATQVLTAPNPYRGGKSFAQDPAVAFVEILNENGFSQKWYEGVIDTLPAPYAAALKTSWNQWLQARYSTEAELVTSWAARNEALGTPLFTNGDFSAGTTNWNLERHSTAVATATANTTYNGQPAVTIAVTTAGTAGWHVQFTRGNFALTANQLYTLSFAAKASSSTPLSANLTRASGDYGAVSPSSSPTLGTDWTTYTLTFVAASTESNVRLVFNGFGDRLANVSIAAVSLRPGGRLGGLADGESLAAGNISPVLRQTNSAPSEGQARDWFRYMFAKEEAYWDTMYAHIKTTLGYPGVVFGTIISNAPANPQRNLDAIDTHMYWNHPTFPSGQDFNTENWTVNNTSVVDNPLTSTISGVARQRVFGMPLNCTEYQHASPNNYAGETPLVSAAYGALQDWDSIWMFEYSTGTAEYVTGWFDTGGHAAKMVNNLLAAALFRRGDLSPARRAYGFAMTPETEVELARTRGRAWSVADGSHLDVPTNLATESRIGLNLGANATGVSTMPAAPDARNQISDTEQLVWKLPAANQGLITYNTPRTRGLVGRADGQTIELSGVTLKPGTTRLGWCTLGAMLLEGTEFGQPNAARGLIIATGDQENTGQIWKDSTKTSVGSNWGRAPVLVEVLPATVTLPYAASRVQVWSLDAQGQRQQALTVRASGDRAQFDLGTGGATLWYEFVVAAGTNAAPAVVTQPASQTGSLGGSVTLSAAVTGQPAPTLQWMRNGAPVAGATSSTLVLSPLSANDWGTYFLRATNTAGTVDTLSVQVVETSAIQPDSTRLTNVSTRGLTGAGVEAMVAGWVVSGDRSVLVRASGPILSSFGVPGVLPDPVLDIRLPQMTQPLHYNDNWDSALAPLFATTGAFGFGSSTLEAALSLNLTGNSYTADVKDSAGRTGVALVELYDLGIGAGRIVNLSTRAMVGSGANSLFVGFAINGSQPKKVLIRGVGPTLGTFGVPGVCPDPRLTLYRLIGTDRYPLVTNDDWADNDNTGIAATFQQAGAFALPAESRDSAMTVWLEPGLYSAQMEAKTQSGLGIVEVYELR